MPRFIIPRKSSLEESKRGSGSARMGKKECEHLEKKRESERVTEREYI
jgi:hypothetical protein